MTTAERQGTARTGPVTAPHQLDYRIRFEWGVRGLAAVSVDAAAIVVVDVLSFTTCVSIAIERGAAVLPLSEEAGDRAEFARRHDAILAGSRSDPEASFSLSPESLQRLSPGQRLVLPSPNGSRISVAAAASDAIVLAASLRNRGAVARYLRDIEGPIAIIAAGERWDDGSLRPCIEDLIGAGALISMLAGARSPEADVAAGSYEHLSDGVEAAITASASGQELITWGFAGDVALATRMDVSSVVPRLVDGVYQEAGESSAATPVG